MNIENLINYTYYSASCLVYPRVVFENLEIEKVIKCWSGNKRRGTVIIGKILAGLGFYASDEIVLKNMVINGNIIEIDYSINGVDGIRNKIILEFSSLVYKNLITVTNEMMEVTCNAMIADYRSISLVINKYRKVLTNGGVYTRCFDNHSLKLDVVYDGIKLELDLCKNSYNNRAQHLVLNRENELQSYLGNLVLPKSIDEIYQDIVLYLGDVSLYDKFSISIIMCDDKNEKVTDMICLNNGELDKFMITRNGKMVCLNSDGSWIMENMMDVFMRNVKYENDMLTYSFAYNSGNISNREDNIVLSDLNREVMTEVDSVKVLSRNLSSEKKGINYGN